MIWDCLARCLTEYLAHLWLRLSCVLVMHQAVDLVACWLNRRSLGCLPGVAGMCGRLCQGAYQGRGRAWVGRLQVWTVDGAVIRWGKSRRPPFSYGDTPLLQPCNRATAPSRLNGCVVARLQKSVRQPCVVRRRVSGWGRTCRTVPRGCPICSFWPLPGFADGAAR